MFVIQGVLRIPVEGSVALFLAGAALHLFATTSLMATLARSMPQFGMLAALQLLSGNSTPRASMPQLVQEVMLAAPTTHFVAAG